jgi:hypothetical protein
MVYAQTLQNIALAGGFSFDGARCGLRILVRERRASVLAFWVGGRAIREFAKTDRVLAEMEGVALTALFSGLGVIAKATADRVEENEGNISLTITSKIARILFFRLPVDPFEQHRKLCRRHNVSLR